MFSHRNLWQVMTTLEVTNLGPRGMLGKIIEGITKHCFIQNRKALGLMVSEKNVYVFLCNVDWSYLLSW